MTDDTSKLIALYEKAETAASRKEAKKVLEKARKLQKKSQGETPWWMKI